jgi:uncharacterized protein (TIGR03067 family)
MRRLSLLFAVLCVLPLFGYDSPQEYDSTMIQGDDRLQGTWRLNVVHSHTQLLPFRFDRLSLTFLSDGRLTIIAGSRTTCGTYQVIAKKKPAQLNLSQSYFGTKIETWKCIYKIEGDTLRIGFGWQTDERLGSFDGDYYFVLACERVKK